jgi:hypothetical protein
VNTQANSPGHPAQLGHEHLHREAPAGLQVRGRVGEDRQLLVLRGHVHDRVRHQVHEIEGAGHARGGHVADGHRDRLGAGLGEQLFCHVRGQLDAVHGDPRALSGSATRPVPTANSSADPPRPSSASRSTIGPRTGGSNLAA